MELSISIGLARTWCYKPRRRCPGLLTPTLMAFPPRWHGLLLIPFFLFVGLSSFIEAQELTDAQIDVVSARLREASQKRSALKR